MLAFSALRSARGLGGNAKQDAFHRFRRRPVRDLDRDQIRLHARREIVAVLRGDRRTWIHTVREEFATYYTLADLMRWLGGNSFVQIGSHAVANLQAIENVTLYGDRLYRVRLRDRVGTEITASARLAAALKTIAEKGTRARQLEPQLRQMEQETAGLPNPAVY